MLVPSHANTFGVLCLQAGADGRESVLYGDCLPRVRSEGEPFMVGKDFPDIYFEFPLIGDPFLDMTVLYDQLDPGTRIPSRATEGSEALLDWYAREGSGYEDVSFGFELDVSRPEATKAAVHFQPRTHIELVKPFCAAIGEPERADLYLAQARRMPSGWPLSYFGLFRGRPGSPLRACGYLSPDEKDACAQDEAHLASRLDALGFEAYDGELLAQASSLLGLAVDQADFQIDVLADGSLSDSFALDLRFGIAQPRQVRANFEDGPGARIMERLESWGAADERWRLTAATAFAKALPVTLDDGGEARYAFTLMPQWLKARWRAGRLEAAKLYLYGTGTILL